jgi:hypothetical protein
MALLPKPSLDTAKFVQSLIGDEGIATGIDVGNKMKMPLAGVVDTFGTPDTGTPIAGAEPVNRGESFIPSALTGMYGGISALLDMGTGVELPGGERASQLERARIDQTNKDFGLDDPKSFTDMLLRYGPVNVIPFSTGMNAVSKTGKIAQYTAEIAIPLMQKPSMLNVGIGLAAPPLLMEAIDAYSDQPNYNGFFDDTPDVNGNWMLGSVITGTALVAGMKHLNNVRKGPTNASKLGSVSKNRPEPTSVGTAIGQGSVDGQMSLEQGMRQGFDLETAVDYWNDLTTSTGDGSNHMATELLRTGQFPQGSGLTMPSFAKLIDDSTKLTKDELRTFSEGVQALDILDTRSAALKHNPKLTNKQVQSVVVGSVDSHTLRQKAGAMRSDPKLSEMADRLGAMNNRMLDYMTETEVITKDMAADFRQKFPNYMTNIAVGDAPRTFTEQLKKSIKDSFTLQYHDDRTTDIIDQLKKRNLKPNEGPSALIDPIQAFEQYAVASVQYAQRNRMKRSWLKKMETVPTDNPWNKVVKKEADNYKGTDSISFMDASGKHVFSVSDPAAYAALQFNPYRSIKALDLLRKTFQVGTTGHLNPFFSLHSALYEAGSAAFSTPAGRANTGLFDRAARAATGGRVGVTGDITAVASIIPGTLRAGYAPMARNIADYFQRQLDAGTTTAFMPKKMQQQLARNLSNAYLKSTYHSAQKYGGISGGLFADEQLNDAASLLNKLTITSRNRTAFGRMKNAGSNGLRFYQFMQDSVRNSIRLEFIARNIKPDMDQKALTKLMGEARRLSGDPTRRGTGSVASGLSSAIPYFTPTVQEMRQIGRQFKGFDGGNKITAPMRLMYSFGMTAAMAKGTEMLWNMNLSEEHKEFYELQIPEWEKLTRLIHMNPDDPADYSSTPMHPLLAPAIGVVYEAFAHIYGLKEKYHYPGTAPDVTDGLLSAGARAMSLPISTVSTGVTALSWMANAMGLSDESYEFNLERGGFVPIKGAPPSLAGGTSQTLQLATDPFSAEIATLMESIFGLAGGTLVQLYREANHGANSETDTVADRVGEQFMHEVKRRVPTLFGGEIRRNSVTGRQRNRYESIKRATTRARQELKFIQNKGTTGGAYPRAFEFGGFRTTPTDEQMLQVLHIFENIAPQEALLQDAISKHIIDRRAVQSSGQILRAKRQELLNTIVINEQAAVEHALFIYGGIEKQLQNTLGADFDLSNFQVVK